MKRQAPKYFRPSEIIKAGYRRVTKSELKDLGYSPRSALYTKAGIKKPKKFVTRRDIKIVKEPERLHRIAKGTPFRLIKSERIRSLKKKRFKHLYTVYSDYKKPISLSVAIDLVTQFFDMLKAKHHPIERNTIGIIFMGENDDFSIQPRYWRDRDDVLDELRRMLEQYKSTIKLNFIVGWIEQAT